MPSCAAWGETSLISTDWDLKKQLGHLSLQDQGYQLKSHSTTKDASPGGDVLRLLVTEVLDDHVAQLLQFGVAENQGRRVLRRVSVRGAAELRPEPRSRGVEPTVVGVFAELGPQVGHQGQPVLAPVKVVAQPSWIRFKILVSWLQTAVLVGLDQFYSKSS